MGDDEQRVSGIGEQVVGEPRQLDREPTKQILVRTMISMCQELGITVIAEGVETLAERDALAQAGCDLMQGYLFAKPMPKWHLVGHLRSRMNGSSATSGLDKQRAMG